MSKKLTEMSLEELWQLFPIILTKHQEDWKEWYLEEDVQRAFEVFVESPVSCEVVASASGHESKLDIGTLFGCEFGAHDAVDDFAECAVATQYEDLGASFLLYEFSCQFYSVVSIFSHAIYERLTTCFEQSPQVKSLHTECAFT